MENKYAFAQTSCGRVRGLDMGAYELYRGIRYATAERFESPVPVEHWDGELDATEYGPAFLQYTGFYGTPTSGFMAFYPNQYKEPVPMTFSEDALNLNIWTPKGASNCPVAVFIHGGSFLSGANCNGNVSNGEEYCRRGVILVNINYRLNAFGNAVGDGCKGNYMLRDQIAALRWIRDHISSFGGDPERVTVIGESAGAISIQCLLLSPQARGLFAGAIMMSGGGVIPALGNPTYPEFAQVTWRKMKEKFGARTMDELKVIPAKELYDAWNEVNATCISLVNNVAKPMVDGDILPYSADEALTRGCVIDVPCIIGVLSEDMWPVYLYKGITEWARMNEAAGRAPVYGYYMDRQMPGGDGVGAYHGCDLWYAFHTMDRSWRPFEDVDHRIADDMGDYFCSFAASQTPSCKGKAVWEPLKADDPAFLRFGVEEPSMVHPPVEQLVLAPQNITPFPGMG